MKMGKKIADQIERHFNVSINEKYGMCINGGRDQEYDWQPITSDMILKTFCPCGESIIDGAEIEQDYENETTTIIYESEKIAVTNFEWEQI